MKLALVDDYGDFGYGGHYAIAVLDDDLTDVGTYLGEAFEDEPLVYANDAVKPLACKRNSDHHGVAFIFPNKKTALKALAAARAAVRKAGK